MRGFLQASAVATVGLAIGLPSARAGEECGDVKIESVAVTDAPKIDGRGDDPVWAHARATRVKVREVSGAREGRSPPVIVKSVRTVTHIYFLVSWADPTKDATHKTWVWNTENKAYEQGNDLEDVLALTFEHTGVFDADMLSGVEAVWDVWQWKAARTDPAGYAMDKIHRFSKTKPAGKAKSFRARDRSTIWISRPEDEGGSPQKSQPAPGEHKGDRVPKYVVGTPSGSAADVRAKGVWKDGRWTVELSRKLATGYADDTTLDASRTYRIGLAVFDREEDIHHTASDVVELTFVPPLPTARIEEITGVKGTLKNGEFKIAVPQHDLNVAIDGFAIIPPMGTTSWVVFMPMGDQAMIMGDVVLLEHEFLPVQRVLMDSGLTITAIHNHFLRDTPKVMFMHLAGKGEPLALAHSVRKVLDKVTELRRARGLVARERTVSSTLDPDALSLILGHTGKAKAGVYKVVVGRPDVDLRDMGIPVTAFSGFNTWMAFQGSAEKAAVAGDFTMLAPEVAPVIQALVSNGIEVTAVHNHMVHEQPRVFFLHFWGVGSAKQLARGLRAALDRQKKAR